MTRCHSAWWAAVYLAGCCLVLAQGSVPLAEVWHATDGSPDYFALGDPHENYYQGSMKVREITLSVP